MSGRSPRWISLNFGPKIGDIAPGQVITLNEAGNAAEFYVAKHNYESGLNGNGRTLVVRKDCYNSQVFNSTRMNTSSTSGIDTDLNSNYIALLDSGVQTAISTTKFYNAKGNGSETVVALERAVFLLSLTELGKETEFSNTEGSVLPIASTLAIAKLNGSAYQQWTRSPYSESYAYAYWIDGTGVAKAKYPDQVGGCRPAFTLPSSFRV